MFSQPVWAITERPIDSMGSVPSSINAHLQQCNVPQCYSSLLGDDLCSVLLPLCPSAAAAASSSLFLDVDAYQDYHTSAVLASAIEVSTACSRSGQLEFNKWAYDITACHQRKMCGVEISLPFPIDPTGKDDSSRSDEREGGGRGGGKPSYKERLSPLWAAIEEASADPRGSSRCNPFMASLSSSVHGKWAAAEEVFSTRRSGQRPLSNVVFGQGFSNTGGIHMFEYLLFFVFS